MKHLIVPLTVIIPTYNRHDVLIQTVSSLCCGESIPKQIIVIDQSKQVVVQEKFEKIYGCEIVIHHLKQPSSTAARNIGIRLATEELILFCDDDILLQENSLSQLYEAINKNDVALVAAIHYMDNAFFVGHKKSILKDVLGTLIGLKKFWRTDGYVIRSNMRGRYACGISNTVNTEWAMGYFFCVRKSIINKMDSRFDENLIRYAYAEDLDFTYRYCIVANKIGMHTIICPQIYVNHLASKEWRIPKQEEVLYLFANRQYLSYKLFPRKIMYRFIMRILNYMYAITQLVNKEYAAMIFRALQICKKNKKTLKDGNVSKLIEQL
jgi:GT2 family glycosyltransferase